MWLRNKIKFGVRRFVRDGFLTERRATELQRTERMPSVDRQARQDWLLLATLTRAAQTIPAYAFLRGKLPSSGLAAFVQRNLPVISKDELLGHRAQYYPRKGMALPWWSVGRTSGTTGTPLDLFRSFDSTVWEHAFHIQHWRWAGFRSGDRQVVLRGDLVVPISRSRPPYWFHDRDGQQLIVSTRHLNDAAAPNIFAEISRFGASQLRAYPSAAFELARLAERHGQALHFRSIITGSETLYPVQRERITNVLGGTIFDCYGMAERNIFAGQCEAGSMHVHPEYSIVEIVDQHGAPTHETGMLVGTTFNNLVMPLLRYRLNDSARWRPSPCPCGRTHPVIEGLTGKVEEQVFDLDGAAVSPSVVTFAFKGVHNIQKSQVAQISRDRWIVRIVPAPAYSAADGQALIENFRTLVSPRLNVGIKLVDEIPPLPSGKFKWVTQLCPSMRSADAV